MHAAGVSVPLQDLLALPGPADVGQVVQLLQAGGERGGEGGSRDWGEPGEEDTAVLPGVDEAVQDVLTGRAHHSAVHPAEAGGDGVGGHDQPAALPLHPVHRPGHVLHLQADVEHRLGVGADLPLAALQVGVGQAGDPAEGLLLLLRQQDEGGAQSEDGLQLPPRHNLRPPGLRQPGDHLVPAGNTPLEVVDIS